MKRLFFYIILLIYSTALFGFRDIEREDSFSSSKFNDWLLIATFNSDNVPSFKFVSKHDDKEWESLDSAKNEYYYKGDNSKAGIFAIYNMKYYQYRGYNPLYTKQLNSKYSNMLKRLYFYRFSGKGAGLIALDNSLVAVDTYSKYVYIYGMPIREKVTFGVDVPLEWGAADTNMASGKDFMPFYMYDPVGHVNEDGSVVLYDQYKESFLDKEKRYKPVFNNKSIYR